jgi:hypothetical protein
LFCSNPISHFKYSDSLAQRRTLVQALVQVLCPKVKLLLCWFYSRSASSICHVQLLYCLLFPADVS